MAKFKIATPDQIINAIEGAAIPRVNAFPNVSDSDYQEGLDQAEKEGGKIVTSKQLGTPIFDRLIFLAEGTGIGNIDLKIDEVILSVDQVKNIVRTPIQGRDGTVKEYISMDDYTISVSGILVDDLNPHRQPVEKIDLLRQFCELNAQFKVASKFLDLFGITSVVVESYRIAQNTGNRQVPFRLELLQDEDIELQLTDEQNANS